MIQSISSLLPNHEGNRRVVLKTAALIAVALAAITLGVLAYAKVGEMAKVGTLGASILCGGGIVVGFLAVAYCMCSWTYLKNGEDNRYGPIPTWEEIVGKNQSLRDWLRTSPHFDVLRHYHFKSDTSDEPRKSINPAIDVNYLPTIIKNLQKTYVKHASRPNFQYYCTLTLSHAGRQFTFNWGHPF